MSMKTQSQTRPRLTLVGAGPGDPDLITIKGVKTLQSCDVILYDALVSKELLNFAPQAVKIFVGKRRGKHSLTQSEINELIVDQALKYGHIVRLKGGDPFVFGRGSEEIEYAQSFGIACELIPGVSSAIAGPAAVGISLTKRQVTESFWVVTGTTKDGELSKDIPLAAASSATVVILMGMHKLKEIAEVYRQVGKVGEAVGIIQNASLKNQRCLITTAGDMELKATEEQFDSPAIIVIGEVVNHRLDLELLAYQYTALNESKRKP